MEKSISELQTLCEDLLAELPTVDQTKASAARARKLTTELGKVGKTFRKESIEFHKK